MSLDVIFAYVVGVLAALAIIGALAFTLVWEWFAIRRTLAAHRRPAGLTSLATSGNGGGRRGIAPGGGQPL
jgi:hypothetical protein